LLGIAWVPSARDLGGSWSHRLHVRHIKTERMWLMNTHAIFSACTLSLLQTIPGEFVLQLLLIACMCLLSLIGLITSLRL
jgi:hypothetical protein